jgi:hypothetical protein
MRLAPHPGDVQQTQDIEPRRVQGSGGQQPKKLSVIIATRNR